LFSSLGPHLEINMKTATYWPSVSRHISTIPLLHILYSWDVIKKYFITVFYRSKCTQNTLIFACTSVHIIFITGLTGMLLFTPHTNACKHLI